MNNLIVTGGRIVDPANGRDEIGDIAFADGKVAEIGRNLSHTGAETADVAGISSSPALSTCTPMSIGAGRPSASMPRRSRKRAAPPPLSTPVAPARAISTASGAM